MLLTILRIQANLTFTSNLPSSAVNTPSFFATASADQTSLSSGSFTKIQYNTELFDSSSAYDTSNYKFVVPSGGAGKYFLSAGFNSNGSTTTKVYIYILVNLYCENNS